MTESLTTDKKELLDYLEDSFDELKRVTDHLSGEKLGIKVGTHWDIGQLLEHLIKVQAGILWVFKGQSVPASRKPLEKLNILIPAFQDDNIKLQASEGVKPNEDPKDLIKMIDKFKSNRLRLIESLDHINPEEEYTGFSHHAFGTLTGAEWIYLEHFHTHRHLRQLASALNIHA